MTLTEEQKKTVSGWVAAGDSLSVIQKKLSEQMKISMTYMDVRFLVDDLNLQLQDPPPKPNADLGKPAAGGRKWVEPPPRRKPPEIAQTRAQAAETVFKRPSSPPELPNSQAPKSSSEHPPPRRQRDRMPTLGDIWPTKA